MKKLGFKKGDIFVLAAIIALECILALIFVVPRGSGGNEAVIKHNGKIVKVISLNAQNVVFEVPGNNGAVELEIKNSSIAFVHSVCPDQTCVRTGWINHSGRVAACIPNGILIEIRGKADDGLDAVVG